MIYEKQDNVGAQHSKYAKAHKEREMYEACIEGTLELREHAKQYIPQFPAEDDDSYKFRINTLTHFNLTKKTRDVMTGLVFKSEIELGEDVNAQIVTLTENIDNSGTHLDVFARKVMEERFAGYAIILADSPSTNVQTLEEQRALNLRPFLKLYKADSIWNWDWEINPTNKAKQLTLLVLREVSSQRMPTSFVTSEVVRFRVFRLINGVVTWELWREQKDERGKAAYILENEPMPIQGFDQIPVAIVGKLGECPPLLDIALKNIEHTQTYSDYKSILHKTCVPQFYITGLDKEEASGASISANMMWVVGDPSASVGYAEVAGSSIETVRQALQDIREEIALMGLALLSDKTTTADLTATEALLDNVAETAELRVWARELQDALELSFGHLAVYLGLPREQGGSLTLGSIWNMSAEDAEQIILFDDMTISEFDRRLEIVNKAEGFLPMAELVKMLFPNLTDAELEARVLELSQNQAVRDAQSLIDDNEDDPIES